VLAAQCATLQKHYGSITGVAERYKTLWSIVGCYVMEELWIVTEREHYGALMERYGTVTENITFAHL